MGAVFLRLYINFALMTPVQHLPDEANHADNPVAHRSLPRTPPNAQGVKTY